MATELERRLAQLKKARKGLRKTLRDAQAEEDRLYDSMRTLASAGQPYPRVKKAYEAAAKESKNTYEGLRHLNQEIMDIEDLLSYEDQFSHIPDFDNDFGRKKNPSSKLGTIVLVGLAGYLVGKSK